ncbi:YybH family protein [Streptomyces sp. NPDC058646]|uniref:YybH family protein n=1 Tax=Streptomyces sp. NPDC058646 TaxID=3346574 RepID=UPI003666B0D4
MAEIPNSVTLPEDLEKHIESYLTAFNAGDAEAVNRHYTDEAIAVWEPGSPISGKERRDYVVEFLATQKPTMQADVREAYVTGDTALLVVDWKMEVAGPDDTREHLEGSALDVMRRDEDGNWLYAIDDPFGDTNKDA